MSDTKKKIENALDKLEAYLEITELKGYDPYDAMRSPILNTLSFNRMWPKIAFTQFLKRFPINIRPLLGISKGYNPKGLGLFLSGYVKLFTLTGNIEYKHRIHKIAALLEELRSHGYSGACWGYNFDWQNALYYFPEYTPTIVNTAFIADGFLDAYDSTGQQSYFDTARSACDFILKDLLVKETDGTVCFSYTPLDKGLVHNANMLGARLLARVYSYTKEKILLDLAEKAVNYTLNRQKPDGSWVYGESSIQQSIDTFHTGFVLESLSDYIKFVGDRSCKDALIRGVDFFDSHFFLEDGTPKYYHNRLHPIDIHSIHALITLVKCGDVKDNSILLKKIAYWFLDNMQDSSGYFYYRKGRLINNKISYIRWSQAWAFHALTTYYSYLVSGS